VSGDGRYADELTPETRKWSLENNQTVELGFKGKGWDK